MSKWIYIYIIITIFPFGQTFLCNLSFIFLSFSDLRKNSLEHSKHKFTLYIGAELGGCERIYVINLPLVILYSEKL